MFFVCHTHPQTMRWRIVGSQRHADMQTERMEVTHFDIIFVTFPHTTFARASEIEAKNIHTIFTYIWIFREIPFLLFV